MERGVTHGPHNPRRRQHDPEDSEAHAHRRTTDADSVMRLHDRVDDHDREILRLDGTIGELVRNMKGLTDNTGRLADVLEAWNNVRGFWWTIKALSALAKLASPILLFLAAMWVLAKTGQWKWP